MTGSLAPASHGRRGFLTCIALAPVLAAVLGGCKHDIYPDFKPPVVCDTEAAIDTSVFFIGDAGAPELPKPIAGAPDALVDPVLLALQRDVAARVADLGAERVAVVVLGDNIYPSGLALPGEKDRERGERILNAMIAAMGDARGFFTLGNHDWDQGKAGRGWEIANTQAQFLSAKGPNISIHPPATCAGADVVDFGNHVRFLFVDLWAAIYEIDNRDGRQAHCPYHAGEGEIVRQIEQILAESKGKEVIWVSHAPMMTSGPHGGYFPWREHIFPLRVFHRDLWIPLPIIGSIFPLARIMGVTDTDLMSANYRRYIANAGRLFQPGMPVLAAGGHEHSLQIHVGPTGVFHAVSGAGSIGKVDYVREMRSDLMALAAPGYMRLDNFVDDKRRLAVLALDHDRERHLVYSTCVP